MFVSGTCHASATRSSRPSCKASTNSHAAWYAANRGSRLRQSCSRVGRPTGSSHAQSSPSSGRQPRSEGSSVRGPHRAAARSLTRVDQSGSKTSGSRAPPSRTHGTPSLSPAVGSHTIPSPPPVPGRPVDTAANPHARNSVVRGRLAAPTASAASQTARPDGSTSHQRPSSACPTRKKPSVPRRVDTGRESPIAPWSAMGGGSEREACGQGHQEESAAECSAHRQAAPGAGTEGAEAGGGATGPGGRGGPRLARSGRASAKRSRVRV